MGIDYSLAKTIDRQISSLRRFFQEQSFVEVHVPHLRNSKKNAYRDPVLVSAPGLNFEGSLALGGGNWFPRRCCFGLT